MAVVHPVNQADGPAAVFLIGDILWRAGERLEKVYGAQSYNGVFAQALVDCSIDFEKGSPPETAQGFVPLPKAGSSNPPLLGQIAFVGSPKIMSTRYYLRSVGCIWLIFN